MPGYNGSCRAGSRKHGHTATSRQPESGMARAALHYTWDKNTALQGQTHPWRKSYHISSSHWEPAICYSRTKTRQLTMQQYVPKKSPASNRCSSSRNSWFWFYTWGHLAVTLVSVLHEYGRLLLKSLLALWLQATSLLWSLPPSPLGRTQYIEFLSLSLKRKEMVKKLSGV